LVAAQEGSYADIVTLMFGAEWMYYHWCRRVYQAGQTDPDIRQWVEMHAEEAFFAQARWLKAELDQCGAALPENEQQRLSSLYQQVLEWEIDFHRAAYADASAAG